MTEQRCEAQRLIEAFGPYPYTSKYRLSMAPPARRHPAIVLH